MAKPQIVDVGHIEYFYCDNDKCFYAYQIRAVIHKPNKGMLFETFKAVCECRPNVAMRRIIPTFTMRGRE